MIGLRIERSQGRLIIEQRAIVGLRPVPVWTLYAVDGLRPDWIDIHTYESKGTIANIEDWSDSTLSREIDYAAENQEHKHLAVMQAEYNRRVRSCIR